MKFAYFDESGNQGAKGSDVFVMAGLLIDAYRFRKHTAEFDQIIKNLRDKHATSPKELKTKAFINGKDKWSKVDPDYRKKTLDKICKLATSCSKIFALGLSFRNFFIAEKEEHEKLPFDNYWVASAMFISSLIQKKMQKEKKNKGLTVLIFDDNKMDMPKVSDLLYRAPAWFDELYQQKSKKSARRVWDPVKPENRFDQIVDSAFAIKSEHSSLIQVSDAVSYVYRRHLELTTEEEEWSGEKKYYGELREILDSKREKLGQTPESSCLEFYKKAKHKYWLL